MVPDSPHDPDFSDIEAALRGLRPSEPSSALEARVFAVFDAPPADETAKVVAFPEAGTGAVIHWFRPIAAAAAVAGVFLGGVWMLRDRGESLEAGVVAGTPVSVEAPYQPVSAGNVFGNATDEGVVYPDAKGEPVRRVRYQYHDTYEWRNPEDGSLIRLAVPQEKLLYLPVETD